VPGSARRELGVSAHACRTPFLKPSHENRRRRRVTWTDATWRRETWVGTPFLLFPALVLFLGVNCVTRCTASGWKAHRMSKIKCVSY